jgi:hypothetical protein
MLNASAWAAMLALCELGTAPDPYRDPGVGGREVRNH